MTVIFKSGIESVATNFPDYHTIDAAEYNASLKQAILEVKDRKKLAKRIIKAIQPQLEAAVRAEADLLQKSPEKMVADLELVLEGCVDISPEALLGPTKQVTVEQATVDHLMEGSEAAADDSLYVNQQISVETEAADSAALAESKDVDMLDVDAPGEKVDEGVSLTAITNAADGVTETNVDDAAAQLKAEAPETKIQTSDTPPGTSGGPITSLAPHHPPRPPTPPVSNPGPGSTISQDLAPPSASTPAESLAGTFLTEGGKPWYLKHYDPAIKEFVEPQWTGREAARGMSEELSEIDDEELRDLGEGMDVDSFEVESEAPVENVEGGKVAKPAKKGKVRRRWKGFK